MSEDRFVFDVANEGGTAAFGRALAKVLPRRITIGLNGPLGAGKTRLVQALAEASGIDRRMVNSPTFVLVQEYHGPRMLYHIDAYRLRDEDEFLQLGIEDYFNEEAVVLIEWAERVANALPADRIDVMIHVGQGESRRFEVIGRSPKTIELLKQLRQASQDEPA
jgi:tRNA threonylcarbamoyladenosine biosynthesis protein TsaE